MTLQGSSPSSSGNFTGFGRILGLVFFVGVGWFAVKRAIPKSYGWRLAALFVLGGLQGAVGWFMVLSGLEGRTKSAPTASRRICSSLCSCSAP